MSGDVFAYLLDLLCQVSNEGGGSVGRRVRVEADEVDVCAWIYGCGEVANRAETFSFVAVDLLARELVCIAVANLLVTESMPDD